MAVKRPASLTDLTIALGAPVPNFTAEKFRRQTSHIALLFLRNLRDVHKYVLDGSRHIFVYFGVPERQRELLGTNHYFRDPRGGWSSCCLPRFDWKAFNELGESEQDERTTMLLEKVLSAVARLVEADVKPIRETAKRIRAGNFTLRFPIEGLTCHSPDSERTVRVWSHIFRGVIRWQVVVEDAEGSVLREEWIPDECYRYPDFSENTLHAIWNEQGFMLRNVKNQVRYKLCLDDERPKSTGKRSVRKSVKRGSTTKQ